MKQHVVIGAAVVVIAAACGGSIAQATAGAPLQSQQQTRPAQSSGSGLKYVDDVICGIVGTGSVTDAAKNLISHESEGRFGALFADIVITTVATQCKPLLGKAQSAIGALYHLSSTPRQPSLGAFLNTFAVQPESVIAGEITINGQAPSTTYIDNSVSALCSDMNVFRSPDATLERFYPNAKLSVLGALNGVASLAIRRCPLDSLQSSFLTSAILSHLTANQYASDRDPPIVVLYAPTETRSADGTAVVRDDWNSFDFSSGVRNCYVLVSYNGQWYPTVTGVVTLRQGTDFRYAIRCVDNAGNYSAWSVGTIYKA